MKAAGKFLQRWFTIKATIRISLEIDQKIDRHGGGSVLSFGLNFSGCIKNKFRQVLCDLVYEMYYATRIKSIEAGKGTAS